MLQIKVVASTITSAGIKDGVEDVGTSDRDGPRMLEGWVAIEERDWMGVRVGLKSKSAVWQPHRNLDHLLYFCHQFTRQYGNNYNALCDNNGHGCI